MLQYRFVFVLVVNCLTSLSSDGLKKDEETYFILAISSSQTIYEINSNTK